MSTKGMSVTACRHLADTLCGRFGIPLLVLHDFDKAGFSMVGTFKRNTRRYKFEHNIKVIDIGLRLEDVKTWGLESEEVFYGTSKNGAPIDPRPNLRKNGATDEEIRFLCGQHPGSTGYKGRRVELNAFTSGGIVECLKRKLDEHGIAKVIPDGETLELAYRRAFQIAVVNEQLGAISEAAGREARKLTVPETLSRMIRKRLKDDPTLPWDTVIAEVAAEHCKKRESRSNG